MSGLSSFAFMDVVFFIMLLFLGIAKNENDVTEDKNERDKAPKETTETVVFTETNTGYICLELFYLILL